MNDECDPYFHEFDQIGKRAVEAAIDEGMSGSKKVCAYRWLKIQDNNEIERREKTSQRTERIAFWAAVASGASALAAFLQLFRH